MKKTSRVKAQRRSWVQGVEQQATPVKLSRFEKRCKRLGISSDDTEQCAASPVLCKWVQQNLDLYFVPELLLQYLKLTTMWEEAATPNLSYLKRRLLAKQRQAAL